MKKIVIFIIALLVFVAIFLSVTYFESLKNPTNKPHFTETMHGKDSTEKLLKTVTTRPTLTPSDLVAKEQLIGSLKNKNGIVSKTENYTIEYIKSADSFMAEIKSSSIDLAKQEVINYFRSRGITDTGICSLPLVFYLNSETASDYSLKNETFNPIPDFCN